jgi:hypothetical protein
MRASFSALTTRVDGDLAAHVAVSEAPPVRLWRRSNKAGSHQRPSAFQPQWARAPTAVSHSTTMTAAAG